ncbi:MAG: hypothetical protein M3462_14325 [Chloroflexota bacterium]|nr:hypothetical protein [Chloroflexota bacterium]
MRRRAGSGGGDGTTPFDRRRGVACLQTVAILLAPFIGLLYGVTAGLAVMTVTLAAIAGLVRQAMPEAPAAIRPRLRVVVLVNLVLAVACALAVVWRVA